MEYISDAELYQQLSNQAACLRRWQVGQEMAGTSHRYFDWLEFLVKGFWTFIVDLARRSGDKAIYFYDLEQAQTSNFVQKFGVYPVIRLDADLTESEYIAALNKEPGEVFGHTFALSNTNAYLIFPASAKWCVHGEYVIEMSELVTTVGLPEDSLFPHDFWAASEAMRRVSSVK